LEISPRKPSPISQGKKIMRYDVVVSLHFAPRFFFCIPHLALSSLYFVAFQFGDLSKKVFGNLFKKK
jgi:hypothetical protein